MAQPGEQDEAPLTRKGRATRDRIVGSAAEILLSGGLSALSMDAVRQTAAVSGSQLSHYFTDKRTLIHAVLARQMQGVLDFHRQPKLGELDSFEDFERWINLNMHYLRRIGYTGTPTYHALVGQLAKSDNQTRAKLAEGYRQWAELLEQAIQQMKDRGVLVADAGPGQLAQIVIGAHQGGGTMAFTYRQEWPLADALRFAVNHLRSFATDPAERTPRRPRRPRARRSASSDDGTARFTRKGLETRGRIIDATAELMYEHGVAGTSVEDVRSVAAVSGSQMSHYFRDKRDLTRHVISARRRQVQSFHTRPPLGKLDSLDALRAWADACIADAEAIYRRGGCVYGSLVGELIDADEVIRDDLAAGYDEWIELFQQGITAMRKRGELIREADPRHLAVCLVVAHQGGAMLTHVLKDPEPLRANVNAAVDYACSFTAGSGPRGRRRASATRKRDS